MTWPDSLVVRAQELARRRSVQAGLAAVVVVAVVAGILISRSGLPAGAAFEVNGTAVTETDLRQDVATLRALYGVEAPAAGAARNRFWRDSAQAVAVSRVLDDAAERQGIRIAQSQVDRGLAAYVSSLYDGAADGQERFLKAIGNAGTSRTAVEIEVRRRLTVDRLLARVTDRGGQPTMPELKAAFAHRRCTLGQPETRRISNIVVASRADADAVLADLADGSPFAEVARARTGDQATRDVGGDLGNVAAAQLEVAYAKVAFSANPDEVFGPIQTASGWNVGVVQSVTPAHTLTFDDVAAGLAEQMASERRSALWRSWLRTTIDQANIRYADKYRPKNPDALPDGIATWAKTREGTCGTKAGGS